MKHRFKLPVGDWSDDGHGKCDWHMIESNKPVEIWREAYFAAREKWPALAPDSDDLSRTKPDEWPKEEIKVKIGFPADDLDAYDSEGVALYTLAFCQRGDPSLKFKRIVDDEVAMLPFYGVDKQGRHIGHIGYDIWMD